LENEKILLNKKEKKNKVSKDENATTKKVKSWFKKDKTTEVGEPEMKKEGKPKKTKKEKKKPQ